MLLITETTTDDVRIITEATEDGKKNYFIEGVFMQANKPNETTASTKETFFSEKQSVISRLMLMRTERSVNSTTHKVQP